MTPATIKIGTSVGVVQTVRVLYQAPTPGAEQILLATLPRSQLEKCSTLATRALAGIPIAKGSELKLTLTKAAPAPLTHVLQHIEKYGTSPRFFIPTRNMSLDQVIKVHFAASYLGLKTSVIDNILSTIERRIKARTFKIDPAALTAAYHVFSSRQDDRRIHKIYENIVKKVARDHVNERTTEEERKAIDKACEAIPTLWNDVDKEMDSARVDKDAFEKREEARRERAKKSAQH